MLCRRAMVCYAPLCPCGAVLYRMRMQLQRELRGKLIRDQCRKAAFKSRHALGYECADHGSLPWPLRSRLPSASKRAYQVNLVLDCRKYSSSLSRRPRQP